MKIILGSQSPRRRELLAGYLGADCVDVVPPMNDEELGFDRLHDVEAIEERLMLIVQQKLDDVVGQLASAEAVVLCADTIVVAERTNGASVVLGKPPSEDWQPVIKAWFDEFYSGKTHEVWTGVLLAAGRTRVSRIVKTAVSMPKLSSEIIDWYVSTGESVGKAGGYGIQGQAATLIEKVDGSLTNVIGLPMLEVAEAIGQLG